MKGARVTEAYFYALETYSWSCTPKPVELWLTGAISSGTTWNTRPAWSGKIESVDAAHGYSSSCPDGYVRFTTTATDHGWPTVTLGMRGHGREVLLSLEEVQGRRLQRAVHEGHVQPCPARP